jgi:hypothetical protein
MVHHHGSRVPPSSPRVFFQRCSRFPPVHCKLILRLMKHEWTPGQIRLLGVIAVLSSICIFRFLAVHAVTVEAPAQPTIAVDRHQPTGGVASGGTGTTHARYSLYMCIPLNLRRAVPIAARLFRFHARVRSSFLRAAAMYDVIHIGVAWMSARYSKHSGARQRAPLLPAGQSLEL